MPAEKVSIKEFARRVGYSDAMVNKWIKRGVISEKNIDRSKPQRPQIYFHAAEAEFKAKHVTNGNSKPEKRIMTRHNKAARLEGQIIPPKAAAIESVMSRSAITDKRRRNSWDLEDDADDDGSIWDVGIDFSKPLSTEDMLRMTIVDLDKLKKIREIQKMEQAHAKEAKVLVNRAETESILFSAGKILKAALGNMPARIIDVLRDAPDRDSALIIFEDECDSILLSMNDIELPS